MSQLDEFSLWISENRFTSWRKKVENLRIWISFCLHSGASSSLCVCVCVCVCVAWVFVGLTSLFLRLCKISLGSPWGCSSFLIPEIKMCWNAWLPFTPSSMGPLVFHTKVSFFRVPGQATKTASRRGLGPINIFVHKSRWQLNRQPGGGSGAAC